MDVFHEIKSYSRRHRRLHVVASRVLFPTKQSPVLHGDCFGQTTSAPSQRHINYSEAKNTFLGCHSREPSSLMTSSINATSSPCVLTPRTFCSSVSPVLVF